MTVIQCFTVCLPSPGQQQGPCLPGSGSHPCVGAAPEHSRSTLLQSSVYGNLPVAAVQQLLLQLAALLKYAAYATLEVTALGDQVPNQLATIVCWPVFVCEVCRLLQCHYDITFSTTFGLQAPLNHGDFQRFDFEQTLVA